MPADWRVINKGVSGNKVSDLVTRRDVTNRWATQRLPGQNVFAFEIGRNDWPVGATAAQHYANVVAYLNTPVTGVLQRGWSVRAMANIASCSTLMPMVTAHRAALRNPRFLADTASQPGCAFAGRVAVVPADLIEHTGASRFIDEAAAADTAYYADDSTHPGVPGARIRVTGGDTPQHGVAAGL